MGHDSRPRGSGNGEPPLPSLDAIGVEHIKFVRRTIRRFRVGPAAAREDMLQEVLLQAHRARALPMPPEALLFGITRHAVLHFWRKRRGDAKRLDRLKRGDTMPDMPDPGSLLDAAAAQHISREVVLAALDDLPEHNRVVLVRTALDGESVEAVAAALGVPVNTAHARLHIARRRFLTALVRHMSRRGVSLDDL